MKTVKGLRRAVKDNNGELKIGKISFQGNEGSDIDVHVEGRLLAWVPGSTDDETKLEDVNMTVSSDALATNEQRELANSAQGLHDKVYDLEQQTEDQKRTIERAEMQIKELNNKLISAQSDLRVYEKIMGREITVKAVNSEK